MGGINFVTLAQEYWHIAFVSVFLVYFGGDFFARFYLQSRKLEKELNRSLGALRALRGDLRTEVVELEHVGETVMSSPVLKHLWSEYSKTLHPQRADDGTGQSKIVRWRATALAETFFTEQAIVDTRLKTEFFKHLPGVLTGLGIIGTFAGLIKGLVNFDVSLDPTKAQDQLHALINSVGHAFYVSAIAIGMAMFFTWREKTSVTARYGQVEQLRELIDSLFKGGAGEEYLERLATSSETSAAQALQIKESIMTDLETILTKLTNQQIEAQAHHTGQMSMDVGKAIVDSLSGPMDAITKAVQGVSSNQGDAVNKMLTDVLSSFAAQMNQMFGSQMTGMTDLMLKASEAMQATAIQFGQLAANMDAAGTSTVDAMGERLGKALEAMDVRQEAMNAQMGAFVEQIKALVSESQTESSQKLKDTLSAVGDQVAGVVEQLRRQAEESAQSQGNRQQRFEESTGQAIGSLSGQVEQLLAQSMETNKSLRNSVASLAQATDKAITGMNSGAETLYVAASDFAKAGQGVAETMRAAATATEAIKSASSQLTLSTDAARGIITDYAKTRDTFALMVSELKTTFEAAKRDAQMTTEIVARIEAAALQLGDAHKKAEEYLQGVNDVLIKTHESFQENVERSLREGNRLFQAELQTSVQMLSSAIKNLGDVVEDIPARR